MNMLTIVPFSLYCKVCVMFVTILWSTSCFLTCTQQTRDIDPMLGQRRRRLANVNPTLGQCLSNSDSCQFKSFCQNSRDNSMDTRIGYSYTKRLVQVILCNIYLYHRHRGNGQPTSNLTTLLDVYELPSATIGEKRGSLLPL